MTASLERWHAVQSFVFHESRLLDERRWHDWLGLFADDATYWVPYEWGQDSPTEHVSLFYESVELLRMRMDRLERELSPLEWPPARTNHHLTNVTVSEDGSTAVTAQAYLLFVEYRRGEQRWFSGRTTWRLLDTGAGFRIASKRVDLLNSDQESGHLRFAVPF